MAMDSGVAKRLQQELMSMMMEPVEGVSAFPGDDITTWAATIQGVNKDGVYHGLEYSLSMTFPKDYPMSPPTVKFTTPIWHPNVDQSGNICLDILKDKWSATYTVSTLLLSIQGLLDDPNNDSPLNSQAAQLWDSREEYEQVVRKKHKLATSQSRTPTASC